MDANTINQYQQMIEALMSPDNNVRGQAEAAFNQAKANPDVMVSALAHLLRNNQSEQARARNQTQRCILFSTRLC